MLRFLNDLAISNLDRVRKYNLKSALKETDATDTHSNFSNSEGEEDYGRNLISSIKILDRFDVILCIFATRAKTNISKFQLELAYLKYARSRLNRAGGSFYSSLESFSSLINTQFLKENIFQDKELVSSKQGAGVGSVGGSGEKQIEIDKRIISQKEQYLKSKLEEAKKTKMIEILNRKNKSETLPTIGLVGYTNSGKTAIMNALANAELDSKDRLFETLCTVVKK